MADTSVPQNDVIPEPTSLDQVDALMARKIQNNQVIEAARAVKKERDKVAAAEEAVIVDPRIEDNRQIDAVTKTFLQRRRKSLRFRRGVTIILPHGEIKWRVRPPSLDTPKDEKPLINYLLTHRGGKTFITFVPTLNRKALALAGSGWLRSLRRFVWVGRHEHLTIKVTGEKEPTTLARVRYPNRKR